MKIVVLGLSITSSWGNGHATTFRGLLRELALRHHEVLFLERDQPWYAENRDLPAPSYCRVGLYQSVAELKTRFGQEIRLADCVIVGSYVPEGVIVGEWVNRTAGGITAFYDIDTPVTLAKLERRDYEYLSPDLIPRYQRYLSFTGGPTLERIEETWGSPAAHALYCSVDPSLYYPEACASEWSLGYLGTYSDDRQPALQSMLIDTAARLGRHHFAVAGPLYPSSIFWPTNVARIEHLDPNAHRRFYNAQRYTLNITRTDMVRAGFSPSVRLFEAAACGTPIISDNWAGLETLLASGKEILTPQSSEEVVEILEDLPEKDRKAIGQRARARILAEHTAAHRATELEEILGLSPAVQSTLLQETIS